MIFFYGPRGHKQREVPFFIIPITPLEGVEVDENKTPEQIPPSPEGAYASDPIPDWEADLIEREIDREDMTVEEFLRRTA